MSLPAFQSAMMRLIVEPTFLDQVLARGAQACTGLSPLEGRRLCAIASDPGLAINRTLHKGFRLGKLRTLLPLTCTLLGPVRLGREVAAFWTRRPPSGFSFLPEALEFIAFVQARRLRACYLGEVLAYERASLELERARLGEPPLQHVAFAHDPVELLGILAQGRRPRGLRAHPCLATGRRNRQGRVEWILESCDRDPATHAALPGAVPAGRRRASR